MYEPLSLAEVAKHNARSSCWVIINNKVYDVTEFLPAHPGGSKIILKYAGRDATAAYEPIHPPDALEKNLPKDKHLGVLDTAGAQELKEERESRRKTKDELRMEEAEAVKPPLSRVMNLLDMENVARKLLAYKALAYYSSASDDELTHKENIRSFTRFFFNPRILKPVSKCDPSTTILGFKSSLPIYASGAALAKLGHPLGEANITRGAGRTGIIQMVSYNASLSFAQIAAARLSQDQPIFWQLYKNKDDKIAEARIREIEQLGYKAICLTVDAVVAGNRERDIKAPFELEELEREAAGVPKDRGKAESAQKPEEHADEAGTAGMLLKNDDVDLSWDRTIPWLRRTTKLPIDAVLAAEAGLDGIVISNHGAQCSALPPMEVLYRLRKQRPDVFDKLEVYVDGGVYRGTDVLKALCLGAKAVGLGRAFMYAQSAYGEEGVIHTVRILEREILTGMRLMGATNVGELVPEMVERVDWQPVSKL
ncbi:FMN-dependent dehydrogenase-domain-containing protein [Sparassis latifolia]